MGVITPMLTFLVTVTSVPLSRPVYSFTNRNLFHGTLILRWKNTCSGYIKKKVGGSIPVLSNRPTCAMVWRDYFASPAREKPPKGWPVIKLQ